MYYYFDRKWKTLSRRAHVLFYHLTEYIADYFCLANQHVPYVTQEVDNLKSDLLFPPSLFSIDTWAVVLSHPSFFLS